MVKVSYHQQPCRRIITLAPERKCRCRGAHAIRVAIDEALKCKLTGEKKVIAFNLSGHGHFDMMAREAYHHGQLEDYKYPVEAIAEARQHLPKVTIELAVECRRSKKLRRRS